MRIRALSILMISLLWLLVGCNSPTYMTAHKNIKKHQNTMIKTLSPAQVFVSDEAYIDNRPIFRKYVPRWTDTKATISAPAGTKLKDLMTAIFKQRPDVKVIYQSGVKEDEVIKDSLEIEAKLSDVIKSIGKLVNYHYIIEQKDIIWTPRATRMFQLGVLPGQVKYDMGGKVSSSGGSANAVAGGSVTYNNAVQDDVWDNLKSVLEDLISDQGKFTLGKNTSILTVRDRPNNLQAVADYIEQFNNYHLQQVGIKVQVLEVDLKDEFKRGIDWNLIRTKMNDNMLGIASNLSSNISPLGTISTGSPVFTGAAGAILPSVSGSSPGANFLFKRTNGRWNGSSAIIQYIEQQGKVSIVSEPRFTILNNQIAELKIIDTEGYLKSIKTTTPGALGTTQTALEPGTLTTGFSLYIVPTIFDKEVLLQITTSISRKISINEFSTITGAGAANGTRIQMPNFTDRRFTQRSVVPNNHTLVLTGFKGLRNSTGDSTPFKVDLLGGKGATSEITEIVLLITPVIIRG
jgi:type IVB pilus formation R64 PilN family outer membrane protein